MTALDTAIKATMDKYSVTLFPCIFQPDGKLLASEIETQYNCIVETYIEEEPLDNGNVRISSGFYVFSAIDKNELNVTGDINPKQQLLIALINKIYAELRSKGLGAKRVGKSIAGHGLTSGYETGRAFTLSFEVDPSCLT